MLFVTHQQGFTEASLCRHPYFNKHTAGNLSICSFLTNYQQKWTTLPRNRESAALLGHGVCIYVYKVELSSN